MELKAETRTTFGKKVKALRAKGMLPAELYGHNVKNRHLSVSEKEFMKIFKETGENTVVTLLVEGKEGLPVLISDVFYDSLKGKAMTVDFHQIRMDEKIEAAIPVELAGDAPATKKGFVIVKVLNEITVSAVPAKLPHKFEVDISSLADEGNAIHVKDLIVDKEVKLLVPEDSVIVTVNKAKEEKIETSPPAAEATEAETTAEEKTEGTKS